MNLADRIGGFGRDFVDEWLNGSHEVGIEGGDEIVVVLLLAWLGEAVPRKIVNVPCVFHLYIWKAQLDGPIGLGQKRDVEVGAEGYGGSNGSLHAVSDVERWLG